MKRSSFKVFRTQSKGVVSFIAKLKGNTIARGFDEEQLGKNIDAYIKEKTGVKPTTSNKKRSTTVRSGVTKRGRKKKK